MQRRFYRYNYPDRTTTFRIVQNARREVEKEDRTLRSESRLWERRVSDEDFGVVRLGMGTVPSTVLYVLGEVENFEDTQVREAMKLEEDSKYVSDTPVIISLRDTRDENDGEREEEEEDATRTPITHSLGIAGEPAAVYEFTRSLVAHYVVFHAPMDARLFVLAHSRQEWAWAEALPHTQKDDQVEYLFFLDQMKEEEEPQFGEDEGGPGQCIGDGIAHHQGQTNAEKHVQGSGVGGRHQASSMRMSRFRESSPSPCMARLNAITGMSDLSKNTA